MKRYFLIILLTSCASPRPGPMVSHKMGLENKVISKDIIKCEKMALKETNVPEKRRDLQTKCLEEQGYQVIGWN